MKIWDPEDSDEDGAKTLASLTNLELIAEEWAECHYGDSDCPERRFVHIRDDRGTLHKFEVHAYTVLKFRAERIGP